jgi:carbonic anhydrase
MSEHTCEAVVIHCIDFRLQHFLNAWLEKELGARNYDRISWAGGVKELVYLQPQIDISRRLHKVKKAILINHEDCGAYGTDGTKERHINDLSYAGRMIKVQYPDVEVRKYYLHLDGTFEPVN